MKNFSFLRLTILSIILSGLFSCSNKTEEYATETIAEYAPMVPGKYITYRLDSLVFTNFQKDREIHSYQVKHVINTAITDNLGRPSYRIYRYIRDSAGTQDWVPNGSYLITPLKDRLEVIQDNLRFIRLFAPIKEGFSWKGNRYLPSDPFESFGYAFSIDNNIKDWDNTYTGVNETVTIGQQSIKDVASVLELDDYNIPDTIEVTNNKATIPNKPNLSNTIWVRGYASDSIVPIIIPSNNAWKKLTICNESNQTLKLDTIITPSGYTRNYEYQNDRWTFGRNTDGIVKDTFTITVPVYASRFLSKEKYAKKIGLVQREYELWEFQPNLSSSPSYIGFGIKMWMIDHN